MILTERNGMEWNGTEWNGIKRNGIECTVQDELAVAADFRDAYDVPLWIDQWGVMNDAAGGAAAQAAYLDDVTALFDEAGLFCSAT